MSQITIADLINTLRKAASNPRAHRPAQLRYFSELRQDSVLTHCGTACCVAGDLMLKAHAGASEQKRKDIINQVGTISSPWDWVVEELGLTEVEATLAFHSNTHYQIHALLADLLESGSRLDYSGELRLSSGSTYTHFQWASLGLDDDTGCNLEGLLSWMRSIARKDPYFHG